MTEAHDWTRVRTALTPYLLLVRVENPAIPGTPDLWYQSRRGPSGWVELKHDLAALTLDQVLFSEQVALWGGLCHLMYRHPTGWALYDAVGARALHVKAPPHDAALVWTETPAFPTKAVLSFLVPRVLGKEK